MKRILPVVLAAAVAAAWLLGARGGEPPRTELRKAVPARAAAPVPAEAAGPADPVVAGPAPPPPPIDLRERLARFHSS